LLCDAATAEEDQQAYDDGVFHQLDRYGF